MDLCATPAVELARLIRARELSAAELLAAVLARIADANPAVNAIVTLAAEQATAAAAALDAQAARGSFAGPLHGLPVAVKDLAETAGIRTTFGSACGPRRCGGSAWPGPSTWVTCRCSRRSWPCSRRAAGRWKTPGAR